VDLVAALGIDLPIIQAPMAGVQGVALAAAVSNAGGLGSLPCATLDAASLRAQLDALSSQTTRPYNVNFFCHTVPENDARRDLMWHAALAPYYRELGIEPPSPPSRAGRVPFGPEAADVLSDFEPAVVSFHFGLPNWHLLRRVKDMGSMVFGSATTVEEAVWLEERGADAVIAQGLEAGGHRGMFLTDDLATQAGLFALLPRVVEAVRVPVVAAGGIADARGVAAAMAMGAAAAQVGTAYLLCPEATTSAVHRAAIGNGSAETTAVTNLFTGRPARGVMNRLMRELGPMSDLPPAFPLATSAIAPLRARAESQGSGDFSPMWAGQNVSGCRDVPAAQLTRELAARVGA
jgi:nitronate monooxygenase